MLIAVFSLGAIEIIILGILCGSVMLGLVITGIVVASSVSRRRRPPVGPSGKPFIPSGVPIQIRGMTSADKPIASSAAWNGSELVVSAQESSCKSLFDVPLPSVDQCMITYRFRIQTDNLQGAVYPEMWCRIPDKGQFFSRGLDRKVRNAAEWTSVEIPFYLEDGQKADLVHLNLVFEGAGNVRLKDIEVLSTPLK